MKLWKKEASTFATLNCWNIFTQSCAPNWFCALFIQLEKFWSYKYIYSLTFKKRAGSLRAAQLLNSSDDPFGAAPIDLHTACEGHHCRFRRAKYIYFLSTRRPSDFSMAETHTGRIRNSWAWQWEQWACERPAREAKEIVSKYDQHEQPAEGKWQEISDKLDVCPNSCSLAFGSSCCCCHSRGQTRASIWAQHWGSSDRIKW